MLRFTCLALLVALISGLELKASINNHWESFKAVHKKSYAPGEESKRKEIFKSKVEAVLKHNLNADLGLSQHRLGINQFSDVDDEEFRKNHLGLVIPPFNDTITHRVKLAVGQPPATRDWSQHMGPVKNQGSCGSCWAFMTTGVIEGHYSIYKGRKVSLSEQNLMDCSRLFKNQGCQGGHVYYAMLYIIANGGISLNFCYPYIGIQNWLCSYMSWCKGAQIADIGGSLKGNENELLETVGNIGPVAVGIDAPSDLSQYAGGVYSNPNCNNVTANHGVVVVGYGTENGVPYWLCKNSWGSSYGLQGYFKLKRGTNECGVANIYLYPIF